MKEDGANITRGRAKDCPTPLAGGAEVCQTLAAMNLFIRSSSAGGEGVIWNVNERNPSLFSSAYLQSSPYLICSRWSTQVGMSERRWWGGGGIFNPDRLLSGENETIYSPMICWYAVAGSPDNHADKDSDAYPLIPWFFFFSRPSGFTPIIAQPNKGGEAFWKELASWKVWIYLCFGVVKTAGWQHQCSLKEHDGIQNQFWILHVTDCKCVCTPPPPHPHCLSFGMKTSKNKKYIKIHRKMLMPPHSHTCLHNNINYVVFWTQSRWCWA